MNEVWNLDPIYMGFDDPAFETDLACAKEKLAAFTAFTATLSQAEPAEALRAGIAMEEQLSELAGECLCGPVLYFVAIDKLYSRLGGVGDDKAEVGIIRKCHIGIKVLIGLYTT